MDAGSEFDHLKYYAPDNECFSLSELISDITLSGSKQILNIKKIIFKFLLDHVISATELYAILFTLTIHLPYIIIPPQEI